MGRVKISYDEAVKLGLTKKCSKCHEIKSVSEFYRQERCKYGVKSICKKCWADYKQTHKQEITEYQKRYNQQYYQNNKEEIINKQRQYRQNNSEKIAKRDKERRKNHREEIAERTKRYQQSPKGKEATRKANQKHRALKNQSFYHPFTQQDKQFCLNYFNYTCPYTGKQLTDSEIHIDHIVALSDKDEIGSTAPWNLLTCEASTNMSKHNKPVLEFINSLPNPDEVYNSIRGYIILQARRYINIIPKDDITLKVFNISFDELKEAV